MGQKIHDTPSQLIAEHSDVHLSFPATLLGAVGNSADIGRITVSSQSWLNVCEIPSQWKKAGGLPQLCKEAQIRILWSGPACAKMRPCL